MDFVIHSSQHFSELSSIEFDGLDIKEVDRRRKALQHKRVLDDKKRDPLSSMGPISKSVDLKKTAAKVFLTVGMEFIQVNRKMLGDTNLIPSGCCSSPLPISPYPRGVLWEIVHQQ